MSETATTAAQTMIRIHDLAFSYGRGRFSIDGLSFDVPHGEFVGLLGPNGSGKSTLVKLLMRLLAPDRGDVLLDGRPIGSWRLRDYAQRVAYLPQESRPAFAFTAMETVLMGRSPHVGALGFESERDWEIAREALEHVDAARFAESMLDELSGGERQRVMLARALAQEAPLLVLDEPASFLDVRHQYGLYRLLRDFARQEGRACLCVGHDVNVAAAYCDRLVVLCRGRLAAIGTPAEVLTPELMREVYEIEADVTRRPDGRPVVMPRVE